MSGEVAMYSVELQNDYFIIITTKSLSMIGKQLCLSQWESWLGVVAYRER